MYFLVSTDVKTMECPSQNNSYDCGIYMMEFATTCAEEYFQSNYSQSYNKEKILRITPRNSSELRKKIKETIKELGNKQ